MPRPTSPPGYADSNQLSITNHRFKNMSAPVTEVPSPKASLVVSPPATERKPLTKKEIAADHPTWCPGCGDFSVLALYFKMIEKRKLWQEKFTTISGIGCSSRFPYFVQAYGAHYIHGRSLPFASGISLSRPDLHVFVFGGDGDLFSIGGNHFTHTARKNIKLTCVAMDNWVYGLTKKQTSPTSPLGFKSKTDVWGAVDYPINPVKQAIAAGASFVARTSSTNPAHLLQMMEAAMDHDGFSFIECLSECVEFYEGAFDAANPRKGGVFNVVPPDHDVTNEAAAYKLASEPFPGYFGLFYKMNKPTKNAKEAGLSEKASAKFQGLKDWQILQKTFDAMK
jgi:2-oxoglutarate ferredoxin oxidoreductase subunit beta